MLDATIKEQVRSIFSNDWRRSIPLTSLSPEHEQPERTDGLSERHSSCSEKLSCRIHEGEGLEFTLLKDGRRTGINFRAIPNGHEFSSLLLAVLNADGKGKNFPDEGICNRVKALQEPIHLPTYVSLVCTNCPDVVQALNAVSTLIARIPHHTVDGAVYQPKRMP